MKSFLLKLTILFFCFSFRCLSEKTTYIDSSDYRIGLNIGGLYSLNKSNIPIIWNANDCGKFNDGTSISFNFGLVFSYTILDNLLWADLRFYYRYLPVNLSTTTSDYQVYNPLTKTYVPLDIEHNFKSSLNYLTIEPGLIFQPIKSVPVKFRFSVDAGNPLFGTNYETTDEIVSPRIYTFPDSTMKHTTQRGSLTTAGTSLGISGGIIYEKSISKNLFLFGEINYRHPLNSALSDYDLKSSMIGINIGIQLGFNTEKTQFKPKQVIKETPVINDTVIPVILTSEINLSSSPIEVLETIVTHTYPILPYIFFDSSSFYLKDKYRQKTNGKITENNVPNNALNIYNVLLDIIGSRMKENPASTLIITGMSDGKEMPDSKELLFLAEKRAQTVADYLISNWSVDKNRLVIKTRETPELATSTSYKEGFEENRRVEITTPNYEILKPVIYSKFKEYDVQSDSLLINKKFLNMGNVKEFDISILAGYNVIFNNTFRTNDSSIVLKFTQNQKDLIAKSLNSKEDIKINYSYYSDNNKISRSYKVDIQKIKNQFELGRLNLIVFDFDEFEINEINKKMINDFVAKTIMDNSTVTITGSTDKLGEKDYNKNLSQGRAESAFRVIKKIKPKADFKEVKGIGDSMLLYDNTLPEGRFYCRTVLIKVTTPIK